MRLDKLLAHSGFGTRKEVKDIIKKGYVKVNGSVIKDTTNNELYENIKMLNINEGKSSIVPNMFINTKNVIANHAASITNINKDYLFYLNCKGIKDKECIKLIKNGFLNNEAR